jgi:fibronectin-binding autotransporter adhesin
VALATINLAAKANLALTAQGALNNNIGVLTLTPTSRITGNGTFTQGAGGTTALQFVNNTAPGAFPTIAANAITLSGKLRVVLTGAFPASGMEDFVKVFAALSTLGNTIGASNVTVVTTGATIPAGTTVTAQLVQSGKTADVVVTESVAANIAADIAANGAVGQVYASAVSAAFEDSRLPREAIFDRLSEPLPAPLPGAPSSMTGAYAADLPSSKKPGLAPVSVRLYQPRLLDFWGQGFGDWGQIKSEGNAAALNRSVGGFVLGGDVSALSFMGGDWRFGVAGGYTNDSIKVSQELSSGTFESVFGGVYAGASFGAVQLRAGALYGTNTTSTARSVNFGDSAFANYGGSTVQAFGEAGYRIHLSGVNLGGMGFSRASVEPFAGAAVIQIHQNGFTEEGGSAPLTGFGRNFNLQTTTLGVKGELAFASMPLTLSTTLGWRHAFGDVVPSALLAFQGGVQIFSASGVPIDRDAFVAEVGVNYAVSSMLTVGLSYSGQLGQRAYDNAFKGRLNLSF